MQPDNGAPSMGNEIAGEATTDSVEAVLQHEDESHARIGGDTSTGIETGSQSAGGTELPASEIELPGPVYEITDEEGKPSGEA